MQVNKFTSMNYNEQILATIIDSGGAAGNDSSLYLREEK